MCKSDHRRYMTVHLRPVDLHSLLCHVCMFVTLLCIYVCVCQHSINMLC